MSTYATGDATKPIVALSNGDKIRASSWTTTGLPGYQFTQSSYADDRRGTDVRVTYSADDLPTRIYDRKTRETIVIVNRDTRVDFLVYGPTGQYTSGVALVYQGANLSLARILSAPGITGQLSALSDRLSFSVVAKADAGLGPLVPAPPEFTKYFNAASGQASASSATSLFAQRHRTSRTAAGGTQAMISTDALRRGLTNAGLLLIGTGVLLPALAIPAGALPLGLFCSGLGAIAISYVPNFHLGALDQFDDAMGRFMEEGASVNESPTETAQTALSTITTKGSLILRSVLNLKTQVGDAFSDALAGFMAASEPQPLTGAPPAGSSSLEGYAIDQSNVMYPLSGSVNTGGQLSATGSAAGRTVTVSGTISGTSFSGTYAGTLGSGTISGSISPLGSCQSQQASGGQGTFARTYNMGQASGSVTFAYDAYTIPDAFQVSSGGTIVFTTGGLVSGTGQKSFALTGSPLVFVAVSAPQSGTAWQFSLTCPQ